MKTLLLWACWLAIIMALAGFAIAWRNAHKARRDLRMMQLAHVQRLLIDSAAYHSPASAENDVEPV